MWKCKDCGGEIETKAKIDNLFGEVTNFFFCNRCGISSGSLIEIGEWIEDKG